MCTRLEKRVAGNVKSKKLDMEGIQYRNEQKEVCKRSEMETELNTYWPMYDQNQPPSSSTPFNWTQSFQKHVDQ